MELEKRWQEFSFLSNSYPWLHIGYILWVAQHAGKVLCLSLEKICLLHAWDLTGEIKETWTSEPDKSPSSQKTRNSLVPVSSSAALAPSYLVAYRPNSRHFLVLVTKEPNTLVKAGVYSLTHRRGSDTWVSGLSEDHLHPRGQGAGSCGPHHRQPGSMAGQGSQRRPPAQTIRYLPGDGHRLRLGWDISPWVRPQLVGACGWAGQRCGELEPDTCTVSLGQGPRQWVVPIWYENNIIVFIHREEILFRSYVVGENSWHLVRRVSVHYTFLWTLSPVC